MPKIVFNASVIFGDPLSAAPTTTTVTVTNLETSTEADLWEDRAGTIPLDNPYEIANPGIIKFYSDAGRIEVEAENGASSTVWTDVLLIDPDASEYTNVTQSTTTRTLGLSDHQKFIDCTNADGCAITVPPQSSVTWVDNTTITGAGRLDSCTFIDTGIDIIIPDDRILECTKGSPWALRRLGTDVWILTGYLVEA